ncbi:alpha/beta fold hydrolase [Pseudoxanthomonas sp. UTMC 1351]|uniref:alpha/beta fold hydrolase n=1 Tax=Pseudoxanthomonas sp. UTMC 1351 TaxID=2695853 RepID=UPI0034CFA0A9
MFRREFLQTLTAAAVASMASRLALPLNAAAANQKNTDVWSPAQFHAARRFAGLPQGKIAFVERGSGPVALFLHGYPLNGYQWRAPMAALATERRCLAPDLMGLGYTDVAADADLSPAAQTAMVIDLLDRLEIADADIVANDNATGIAQLMAAHHPLRSATAVVGAPSPARARCFYVVWHQELAARGRSYPSVAFPGNQTPRASATWGWRTALEGSIGRDTCRRDARSLNDRV